MQFLDNEYNITHKNRKQEFLWMKNVIFKMESIIIRNFIFDDSGFFICFKVFKQMVDGDKHIYLGFFNNYSYLEYKSNTSLFQISQVIKTFEVIYRFSSQWAGVIAQMSCNFPRKTIEILFLADNINTCYLRFILM